MRESKVTDQELNWMYAALVKKQVIDPTYIMVERWICEASSGTGEVGSGCYLTLIAVGDMPKSPSSQYGLKAQEDIDPRGIRVTNGPMR